MLHRRLLSGGGFAAFLVRLTSVAICMICSGQSQPAQHFGAAGANSGNTSRADIAQDTNNGTTTGSQNVGDTSGDKWMATSFTASFTYTAHKIVLRLSKTGSPTGTITAYIYSDSANVPGSVLTGGTSGTINASSLGASEADADLTGLTSSITSGTKYWIVMQASQTADAVNYINWHYDTLSSDSNGRLKNSSNGTSWGNKSNTHSGKFTNWGI